MGWEKEALPESEREGDFLVEGACEKKGVLRKKKKKNRKTQG